MSFSADRRPPGPPSSPRRLPTVMLIDVWSRAQPHRLAAIRQQHRRAGHPAAARLPGTGRPPSPHGDSRVYVWTVNEPDEARPGPDAAVDGIITDRPAFVLDRLRELGLRDRPSSCYRVATTESVVPPVHPAGIPRSASFVNSLSKRSAGRQTRTMVDARRPVDATAVFGGLARDRRSTRDRRRRPAAAPAHRRRHRRRDRGGRRGLHRIRPDQRPGRRRHRRARLDPRPARRPVHPTLRELLQYGPGSASSRSSLLGTVGGEHLRGRGLRPLRRRRGQRRPDHRRRPRAPATATTKAPPAPRHAPPSPSSPGCVALQYTLGRGLPIHDDGPSLDPVGGAVRPARRRARRAHLEPRRGPAHRPLTRGRDRRAVAVPAAHRRRDRRAPDGLRHLDRDPRRHRARRHRHQRGVPRPRRPDRPTGATCSSRSPATSCGPRSRSSAGTPTRSSNTGTPSTKAPGARRSTWSASAPASSPGWSTASSTPSATTSTPGDASALLPFDLVDTLAAAARRPEPRAAPHPDRRAAADPPEGPRRPRHPRYHSCGICYECG